MGKRNNWIIIAVIMGVLCFGMLFLCGFVLTVGGNYYRNNQEKIEAEEISTNSIDINTNLTSSFKEIELDEFEVSYGSEDSKKENKDDDDDKEDRKDDDDDDDEKDDDNDDDFIIPESDDRKLTEDDLEDLSAKELTYARNEIYARHGRKFQSEELQDYFNSKDWYEMDASYDDHELQGVERENAEFISEYQKDTGKTYKAN